MIRLMVADKPTVTIVVIGLRDAPLLLSCLRSIADNVSDVSYEVRVVLCDPTDRVLAELEREVEGADISPFRANLGFAEAANFAASAARGQYIALLNDDCLVRPGWLTSLIDTEVRRPRCGIVSGTFLHPDGTLQEAGSVLWSDGGTNAVGDGLPVGYMDFERRVEYGSGGSLLVRRDVWELLDGLSDAYYPAYYEDIDFCLSAAAAGWETWYQPRSMVVHQRSMSTTSSLRSFLWQRGAETFTRRWGHLLAEREPRGSIERAVWKGMGSPLRVLVIDDLIPDGRKGSGFGRMLDTLTALDREPDIHVSFFHRLPCPPSPFPIAGVRVISDLEQHLNTPGVDYEVVVVSRPDNADIYRDLLDRLLPHAARIYDGEALFHRRLAMQAEIAPENDRPSIEGEAEKMKAIETAVLQWADHAVCISELEAEAARELAATPVSVVSPLLQTVRPTAADFRERSDIGLVAGWASGPGSPNSDGLLWFGREILPRIRSRVRGCRLKVTGFNPPPEVRWLAGDSVEFVGEVKELGDFYNQIRVAISPTRFGAGVKIKSVEAIQSGVPLVCTNEAATGLPVSLQKAAWATDDPAEFADAVVCLLTDERVWENQRSLCLAHYEESDSASDLGSATTWPDLVRAFGDRASRVRTTSE